MKAPRKLDPLIKFFKEVMANPKANLRTRMEAARRLDEIYGRYELLHEKAAARLERAELRAATQREPRGANTAQETPSEGSELSEDERLDAVFGSILNDGKVRDADDTDSE